MVPISFNKEMEDYLSKRTLPRPKKAARATEQSRRVPFYKRIITYFYTDKGKEIVEEEVDIGVQDNEVVEMEEDMEELEETQEKPKKGFFARIFDVFMPDEPDLKEEEFEEVVVEEKKTSLPDDLKEALKIQNRWLKRLDPEAMVEFKESPDYEKYKDILKKYGLIR